MEHIDHGHAARHAPSKSSAAASLALLLAGLALVVLAADFRADPDPQTIEQLTSAPGRDTPLRGEESDRSGGAAASLRDGQPMDLNTASDAELQLIPGIGPALSGRIIEARPFSSVEELLRVRGIGPATLARLRPLLRVNASSR